MYSCTADRDAKLDPRSSTLPPMRLFTEGGILSEEDAFKYSVPWNDSIERFAIEIGIEHRDANLVQRGMALIPR